MTLINILKVLIAWNFMFIQYFFVLIFLHFFFTVNIYRETLYLIRSEICGKFSTHVN